MLKEISYRLIITVAGFCFGYYLGKIIHMNPDTKKKIETPPEPFGGGHASLNDLNKTQVLLLALFVAFVTSIASSIVTVTLLDQAPPEITRTINRVVERTIEVAVPTTERVEVERIREVPVIFTEEDMIADAVRNALPAVVFVYELKQDQSEATTTAISDGVAGVNNIASTTTSPQDAQWQTLGMGFVVTTEGVIITSSDLNLSSSKKYKVSQIMGDEAMEWDVVEQESKISGISMLKIADKSNDKKLPTISLFDGKPVLGKTVFAIGSKSKLASVVVGSIESYQESSLGVSSSLGTSIRAGKESIGAPILDTKGNVIGVLGREDKAVGVVEAYIHLAKISLGDR